MVGRIARGLGLAALLALASGCTTTPNLITPTAGPTTNTFSGLLKPAAVNVFTFAATTNGTVTATLTSIGPDATQTVGFSLGTFDTGTKQCTVTFDNTAAAQGSIFNTSASTAGNYCVRLYDNGSVANAAAAGTATAFTYTVTVSHP